MLDSETTRLINSYYEDLNGKVLNIVSDGDSVVMTFECDDWNERPYPDSRRQFVIRGDGVVESNLVAPYEWVGDLYSTSGMLIEDHHASDWIDVYWKTRPERANEVIGALYTNHERLFDPDRLKELRDYLVASPQALENSSGLLLRGPRSYATQQAVSVKHLLEVYYSRGTERPRTSFVGIGVDDSFMICTSISTTEYPSASSANSAVNPEPWR